MRFVARFFRPTRTSPLLAGSESQKQFSNALTLEELFACSTHANLTFWTKEKLQGLLELFDHDLDGRIDGTEFDSGCLAG